MITLLANAISYGDTQLRDALMTREATYLLYLVFIIMPLIVSSDRAARVFGATGAATLWRREALVDVAIAGQIFDERYHSFREDAELAFRLRERGWEILYEPAAVAEHRRRVLPERRSALPPAVNLHSLKNRYLLRIDHQTLGNFFWTLPATLARDLAALAWVLLRERSSLPAYAWLWRHRRELVAHRQLVQRRRSVPTQAIGRWFLRPAEPL